MRRVLLISVILMSIVAGFFVVFWPKNQIVDVMVYYNDEEITDKNFNQYVSEHPIKNVYYFCDPSSNDCAFVNNNILKEIADQLILTKLDFIHFVDLSQTSTTSSAKYKSQWGFSQYPAFVIVDYSQAPYKLIDTLAWNNEKPFTVLDVKNFLIKNNLWPKP